jgi:hypothetical protein
MKNIGALQANYIADFKKEFQTEVCLWFFLLLYTEDEILEKFEFSTALLDKRNMQQKFLNSIVEDSEWSENYLLTMIKSTIPKLYPTLPTLKAFKENVEAGLFTGTNRRELQNMMYRFTDHYFNHRWFGGDRWAHNFKDGTPGLNKDDGDFYPKIVVVPDEPETPDTPDTPDKPEPPIEPETPKPGPSTASITMGLGIAVAAAIIYSIAKK